MSIQVKDVSFSYQQKETILSHINLSIEQGEFVSIIGKSGCGKSTLLKCMAGLLSDFEGQIYVNDEKITGPMNQIAYLFQRPILLEWRTLLENVLLPLELTKKIGPNDKEKALRLLTSVGLKGNENKFPHELSGGMQARASLARMLNSDSDVLLMDEPFSSLDAITKSHLQQEIIQISQQEKPTIVFVTHDIQEAVFLSDRVLVMSGETSDMREEYSIPFARKREQSLKFEREFTTLVKEIYKGIEER